MKRPTEERKFNLCYLSNVAQPVGKNMAKVHKIAGTEDEWTRPSKSQKKREAEAITKFAERLSNLTPAQLKRISLPEDIFSEILRTIPMKPDEGRRRQVSHISGMIRISAEREEILKLVF